jgi:diacylglycerol kinase
MIALHEHSDQPAITPAEEKHQRARPTLARSFYFAFAGIFYLLRTQRNARIELFIGLAACGLAIWLGIDAAQWAILVLTICAVLILEALNTAIEAVVDLACPQQHRLAKVAKDVAAGAVLIAAIGSVVVGLLILGPALLKRF